MPIGARDPTLAEGRVNLVSCPLPNSMSTVALMQNAVDLRSVFLDDVDPEARDSQQLPCRSWPTASEGSQCLVAEDPKRRHAASSGLGKTPSAQCLFYTGIWSF